MAQRQLAQLRNAVMAVIVSVSTIAGHVPIMAVYQTG
jgi:hypothetical protein